MFLGNNVPQFQGSNAPKYQGRNVNLYLDRKKFKTVKISHGNNAILFLNKNVELYQSKYSESTFSMFQMAFISLFSFSGKLVRILLVSLSIGANNAQDHLNLSQLMDQVAHLQCPHSTQDHLHLDHLCQVLLFQQGPAIIQLAVQLLPLSILLV